VRTTLPLVAFLALSGALQADVVLDWNALMIEGLAQAGAILDRPEWVGQASRAGGFLLDRMRAPDGRFFRAYHPASGPRIPGFLDDHAYAAMAFLQLYQVTLEARWYVAARETVETALRVFTDAVSGAVHFAPSDTGTFARWQDLEDQAVPAANAVFARCLFLLGGLLGLGLVLPCLLHLLLRR
jgi:uncharacterized protein YyaL (SSP411 family)